MDNSLLTELFIIKAIKFGQFQLKSGMTSPVYIDLRILISYPKTLKKVAQEYVKILNNLNFDRMAAVPYTGIPIVSAISLLNSRPWLYTRKEAKSYGIKRAFEGLAEPGEKIVLIDDMITTGSSKLEVIKLLENEGLIVKDIVVLFDREQGGSEELEKYGYRLHSGFTLKAWLKHLKEKKLIATSTYQEVISFLNNNK